MSANETIDARPETIGALITFSSTPNSILIPVYQRIYQWDHEKLVDIMKLTDPDSRDFGFIGTMVFVQNEKQVLEVVDGQQRLITIIIILCALRDYINEYVKKCENAETIKMLEEMSSDIQKENLLVSKSYSEDTDNPRIIFHRTSYDLFKQKYLSANADYIAEDTTLKLEINNFSNNYERAMGYLREKYDHHKKEITPLLNKRLVRLKNLVVNAIYITKAEYAGEVFESINGTGITLKLSELVKNYVFRNMPIASAQTKWDEIEANCDGKTPIIENIIKYDWQNKYEETQDFEIFRSIKAHEKVIDTYLNRLLRVSKIFSFYLHPSIETFAYLKLKDNNNEKNHIIRLATTLRIINVKQFLRLIISLDTLRDYININDYHNLLKNIHNFQIRAKVANINTNEVDRLYSKYGRKMQKIYDGINDGEIKQTEARAKILRLLFFEFSNELLKISTDDGFASGLITFSRSKSTGKDFFKYLLSSIENHLQRNELIIDTKDNQITLEEIYPQDPSEGWNVTDLEPDDIYKFGNATILKGKDNGAGSNKTIDSKILIYKGSNLLINKSLVNMVKANDSKWDKQAIALRAQEMSETAVNIWKIKVN